jgi:ABC-type transport system involved in multi-copper enzyme maturation permease subunit
MIGRFREKIAEAWRLGFASARLVAGRRFWIVTLLPLIWIVFQIFRLLVRWRPDSYGPADAQTVLIGFPLTVLAIGLGVRVIAGEIDRRTLEIAYTVPGGTQRVWLAKLVAALGLLVVAELLLAVATWLFCTEFPPWALYGALQSAVFYMVLSMAVSALLKSEAAGALVIILVLGLNSFIQGANARISPFWNAENVRTDDPGELLALAVQNRIGFVLVIAAITALGFARAENREKLLGG